MTVACETPPHETVAQVRLIGPRLTLRPLDESDVTETYLAWLNDPDVTRYMGMTGKSRATRETVLRYLERFRGSATDAIFAVLERASNRHIGTVTLNHISWVHGTGTTGLLIGYKDCWGKGYARETWSLLLAHAFDRLRMRKLIAGVAVSNVACAKTLERLGFQIEAVLRQEIAVDGRYEDCLLLGLFRDAFKRQQ